MTYVIGFFGFVEDDYCTSYDCILHLMINKIDDHQFILIGLIKNESDGNIIYSLPTKIIPNCNYLAYKRRKPVDILVVQCDKLDTSLEWLTLDEICNVRSSKDGNSIPIEIIDHILSLAPFVYCKLDLSIVSQPKIGFIETYSNGKLKRAEYNEVLGWKVYRKLPNEIKCKAVLLFDDEKEIFKQNFWFVTDDSHIVDWN